MSSLLVEAFGKIMEELASLDCDKMRRHEINGRLYVRIRRLRDASLYLEVLRTIFGVEGAFKSDKLIYVPCDALPLIREKALALGISPKPRRPADQLDSNSVARAG
jgi:hypothetical protein